MKKILTITIVLLNSVFLFGQTVGKVNGVEDPAKISSVAVELIENLGGAAVETIYKNCKEILENTPGATDGVYVIDPDGEGAIEPFDCYCDMTTDGGGWTLVTVHSDDGQANWTFNNRSLFYDDIFIGSINQPYLDYKGQGMVQLNFYDVLALHAPSGVWAAYYNVGNGSSSLGSRITNFPFPNCTTSSGCTMSSGTLAVSGTSLCNTDLFFNIGDYDGQYSSYCLNISNQFNNATYGPAWSVNQNSGCPFDDPGTHSSLGPNIQSIDTEQSAIGFGRAIDGNTGTAGTGANHMKIFVR